MAETKRLGVWGWFVRAFAAGFGATCGVVVASVVAIATSYALIAAGVLAFSSLGGIELNTAKTPAPSNSEPSRKLAPPYPTTLQPSPARTYYPTTAQPAPPVAGPYARTGASYAGGDPHATDPVQTYPASPGYSASGEADNEAPAADAQPAPPVITIPFQPAASPEDGSSAALD